MDRRPGDGKGLDSTFRYIHLKKTDLTHFGSRASVCTPTMSLFIDLSTAKSTWKIKNSLSIWESIQSTREYQKLEIHYIMYYGSI